MDDPATEAEASRFHEIDDAGLRDRVRDTEPWRSSRNRPERELAARRMADSHDDAELELRPGKGTELTAVVSVTVDGAVDGAGTLSRP